MFKEYNVPTINPHDSPKEIGEAVTDFLLKCENAKIPVIKLVISEKNATVTTIFDPEGYMTENEIINFIMECKKNNIKVKSISSEHGEISYLEIE